MARWVIINTKTQAIINVLTDRKAALQLRKELNRQSYFNCDKGYRYRIVENPGFQPID